jgi:hypothetical protein
MTKKNKYYQQTKIDKAENDFINGMQLMQQELLRLERAIQDKNSQATKEEKVEIELLISSIKQVISGVTK